MEVGFQTIQVNIDDVKQGISMGIRQAQTEIEGLDQQLDEKVFSLIHTTLNKWPSPLTTRFVVLFSQLSTIAALSRKHYNHPELTEDDLNAYLALSILFFNSYVSFLCK